MIDGLKILNLLYKVEVFVLNNFDMIHHNTDFIAHILHNVKC